MAASLTQSALAGRAGITRQAVKDIEGGKYVPNTAVAIRLAGALACAVEDIFVPAGATSEIEATVLGGGPRPGDRLAVARVAQSIVAYPLTGPLAFQESFLPADGTVAEPAGKVRVARPREELDRTAVLLGCDPSLGILTSTLERASHGGRLLWLQTSSQAALDALPAGVAHIAGTHLSAGAGKDNVRQARKALANGGGVVVTYAGWVQGFVVAAGNPKGIRSVSDLARPDVRLVNREKGSGSRKLLDEQLAGDDIPSSAVAGYDVEALGHSDVARAIMFGAADVGIGIEAVAGVLGLGFVPVKEVRFDLVIPRGHFAHPVVCALLDTLESRSLRAELGSLPGYDVSQTGAIALDVPAA